MALWELDAFAPAQFLGFIRTLVPPNEYEGTRWLPDQTISDSEFSYVLGAFSRPVMATIMGYDSLTPLHKHRGQAGTVTGELPLIKRKSQITEKTIQRFLTPRANTPDQQQAITDVYIRAADLFNSVQARAEWLRMQALSEETVYYNENGVIFDFDYGHRPELQIRLHASGVGATSGNGIDGFTAAPDFEAGVNWDDTENSNPILDLAALQRRAVLHTGRPFVEMVCSNIIIWLLQRNVQMRNLIRGSTAPSAILTLDEINTLFGLYGLPQIHTYDVIAQSEAEDGTVTDIRMMSQSKAFFVQEGLTVGNTLWGPTAESRVLYGTPLAAAAPGIFAETYGTTEPPSEYVKVAAAAFPTMPMAHYLGQMNILSGTSIPGLTGIPPAQVPGQLP